MATSRIMYRSFQRQYTSVTGSPLPPHIRASVLLLSRWPAHGGLQSVPFGPRTASTSFVPLILQPSFWRSLMPKAFRSGNSSDQNAIRPKKKEWNPATFFIWIFLLIGSQAIQMISMQRDFVQFTNQTDTKLSLLREVLKKVQNGEDVDVEAMLGTGDATKEKEWEEVMRELEEEDALIQSRRQKRTAKEAAKVLESTQNKPTS